MTIRGGDAAPDFTAETTHGTIRFHEWKAGTWAILFSYCSDFAHCCSTELGVLAALMPDFERRNTKVIGLSVHPLDALRDMEGDIVNLTGRLVTFPMIADSTHVVARRYEMIQSEAADTMSVHSVVLIDPANTIKLALTYPASIRPNFDDLPRIIDCLETRGHHEVVSPTSCPRGERVIITPGVAEADAKPTATRSLGPSSSSSLECLHASW